MLRENIEVEWSSFLRWIIPRVLQEKKREDQRKNADGAKVNDSFVSTILYAGGRERSVWG